MPTWPEPNADAEALKQQGTQRATTTEGAAAEQDPNRIFAEDWWNEARPIFEIHGYYRLRAELFHNFSLGRINSPSEALWPMPADNRYVGSGGPFGPALCTGEESGEGGPTEPNNSRSFPCKNKTQAGANMRFRLNPELHISDNLRVLSQVDLLDNLVLGSTPGGYANTPGADGFYEVAARSGYTPLGALDDTQVPPSAGINGFRDSIVVKRVWAEYETPVGELRFGRMPHHWGLGMIHNSGDAYDDDYQSTIDRIQFITGVRPLELYAAGSWDFPNEGVIGDSLTVPGLQPYDLAQLDDVSQWSLAVFRRKDPELQRFALAQGELVVNGGAYVIYRKQLLANDGSGACAEGAAAIGCPGLGLPAGDEADLAYVRRDADIWIPDIWLQVLYRKFRFELELATIQGSIENTSNVPGDSNFINPGSGDDGWRIARWGLATEIEQKLIEDRLRLQFNFGWSSGDPDVNAPAGGGGLIPGNNGLQPQLGDRTFSTFSFHPSYRVDLILNRNILQRIQGVYYFRPGVEYDFVRKPNGQRFGGGFAGIWTRASEFVQTPGHERDLGVELNATLFFQSKDGSLNDQSSRYGGFYTMLQYGVLFPLGGLGYQDLEAQQLQEEIGRGAADTSAAQTLRWYLGVFF